MKTSYKAWLIKRREELDLSQYDLAEQLGIEYRAWRQHCSQNRFPEVAREDMCRVLKTSVKELEDLGFNFAKIERRKFIVRVKNTRPPKTKLYSYNVIHIIEAVASLGLELCTASQILRIAEIEINTGVKFGPEAIREIISSLQKPE